MPIPNHKTYWVKEVKKNDFFKERGQIETFNYGPRGDVQISKNLTKEKLQIVSGNAVIRRMSEEDGGQTDTGETKVG